MKYPYLLQVLLALDRFGAVLFFNCPDMCISSLCWLALNPRSILAAASIRTLNFYDWQWIVLRKIGAMLEFIQRGHCLNSALDDSISANRTISLLPRPKPTPVP